MSYAWIVNIILFSVLLHISFSIHITESNMGIFHECFLQCPTLDVGYRNNLMRMRRTGLCSFLLLLAVNIHFGQLCLLSLVLFLQLTVH